MTSFDPRTTAIVAAHFQNDIVGPDGAFAGFFRAEVERTGVLDTAARLLDGARAAGVPVIYTRVAWKSDYSDLNANSALLGMVAQTQCLQDGSEGAAITDEVTPRTATGSSPTSASAGSPTATSRRRCGPRALRPSSSPAWPAIGRGHRPRGVGPRLPHRRRRRRLLGRLPGGAQRLAGVPRSARRDHHHRGVPSRGCSSPPPPTPDRCPGKSPGGGGLPGVGPGWLAVGASACAECGDALAMCADLGAVDLGRVLG
jgi:hypothetical protein